MPAARVVLTGGQGDLARVIASGFREAGYEVAAPGRDELDVCDAEGVTRYFAARDPDLLVCCAGATSDGLLARQSADDWDRLWQVNHVGARRCAEAVIPAMTERGSGHIVFVSSHSALHPPAGQVAYAAAKRALLGLADDLARARGPANIRVNTILPGFLDNRMTALVTESRKDEVIGDHALGRLNTMERTARFVRFLHEEMPHTSGQWFQLDSRPGRI